MVWMVGMTALVDDGVKTIFFIGRILDSPQRTVRIVYGVRSFHHVSVPGFVRGLIVTGVWVLYAVLERVLGMGLLT